MKFLRTNQGLKISFALNVFFLLIIGVVIGINTRRITNNTVNIDAINNLITQRSAKRDAQVDDLTKRIEKLEK